ncbi:aldose 1-epimerase family protein [Croceicoccus ponticola]|uniref:Aldose 1-epimerase family protein n=1 Tax=Croceicoccus ponticola TaxID=2217664 RepID=A0A437GVP6_9SPHN|nr:aldose 1-epimerase family protein [Croceicoccus ponticola]RVQ65944.1 aldose 1-epimerase family protein [Croceicoccus ponticola]
MSETYAIASDGLTARISSLGAELVSLTDARGNEWLTDGDPAIWAGRSPILFPVVGELAGGKLRVDGAEYELGRHGFARRREFVCQEHEASDRVRFRMSDDEQTRAAYPFRFDLDLLYEVTGTTLTMTATVRNRGDGTMPFSIGFHPGFAWPLPDGGDKLKHRVVFAGFEPGPVRRLDADGLLRAYEDTPVSGRVLNLRPSLFDADAMIWDQLSSRALAYEGEMPEGKGATPAALDMHFPDCPMMGIWQKQGADFVCIEPWAGVADAAGFDGDFRVKPGIMELPAGEERSFAVTITIRPATAGA